MRHGLVLEIAIVLLGIAAPARAETKRVRVPVSSLPRQDNWKEIEPKETVVLPDGAREGSPVPKSWKVGYGTDVSGGELGHCTDDRRGSVATGSTDETSTEKIWETNGKVFYDRARVRIDGGKVHVLSADRVPVVYVSESVWAYRDASTLRLVFARDSGSFSRAIFWGCSLEDHAMALPTGGLAIDSSPEQIDNVLAQLDAASPEAKRPKRAPWKGIAFNLLASVSKASADPEPMLNLIIK